MNISWELGATVAGGLSFVGILFNIVLTISQSKKQRISEIISKNRIEWMQKLKEYMSEYNSLTLYFYDKKIPKDSSSYLEKIYLITFKIKLHLNLKGEQDKKIIKIIDDLNASIEFLLSLIKDKAKYDYNSNKSLETKMKNIEHYLCKYPELNLEVVEDIAQEDAVKEKTPKQYRQYISNIVYNKEEFVNRHITKVIEHIDKKSKECTNQMKYSSELITLLTQIYLKTEWERVKFETKEGNESNFKFDKMFDEIKTDIQDEINKLQEKINKKYI